MRKRREGAARGRDRQGTGRGARRRRVDTKESLLDAAERLFATRGIQAVSLRMINVAAGARNASAAHYHFRSRDSLFKAVVRRRMDKLSQARLELLDHVEQGAGGEPADPRAVIEAVILPTLWMLLDERDGGANYVRFLARVAGDPTVRFNELATELFNEVLMRVFALLHRTLPHVPPAVLADRMMFGIDIGVLAPLRIDSLARRADGTLDRAAIELFAARLIDYIAGGMSAPVWATRIDITKNAAEVGLADVPESVTRRRTVPPVALTAHRH